MLRKIILIGKKVVLFALFNSIFLSGCSPLVMVEQPTNQSESYTQVLYGFIEPHGMITDYAKYLRAGEQVAGVVQLTGLLDKKEWAWSFSIFYREHDQTMSFIDHWQTSWSENKHAFGFTAEQDGEYILRISTDNSTALDARIDVTPGGWK